MLTTPAKNIDHLPAVQPHTVCLLVCGEMNASFSTVVAGQDRSTHAQYYSALIRKMFCNIACF